MSDELCEHCLICIAKLSFKYSQIFSFINIVDTVNLPMSGDSNAYVPGVSPMKKGYSISKAAPHFLLKQNPYIYFQIVCGTVVMCDSVWYCGNVW